MAETESNPKWPVPDLSAAANSVSAASKTLQVFVDELTQITQKNFEQTTKIMEELQNVRTLGDLLTIQTKFVQETFDIFNQRLLRMSALMAAMPNELAQVGRQAAQDAGSAVSESVAAMNKAAGEISRD